MLVCHCHCVSEKRIREIARTHGATLRQVALSCRAGTDCGGCRSEIRAILAEERCTRALELVEAASPLELATSQVA
jgi:bacterioferritin-associated ferredoxin